MTKMLVFDMDGTIADFYGVDGWLADLNNESTRPYKEAKPLYNMDELKQVLNMLKADGWRIAVTTWVSKTGSDDFHKRIATVKKAWLALYDFPYDEIHCVKYGTTKANCTRNKADFQILFDDNEKIRKGWKLGATVNAKYNILDFLKTLV